MFSNHELKMSEKEKKKEKEIEPWSPFDITSSFEDIWRDFYRGFRPWGITPWHMPRRLLRPEKEWEYTPLADLVDEGDKFIVRADIPGFSKENVNIEITDDSIELSGEVEKEEKTEKEKYRHYERSYSSFRRTLRFPTKVKPQEASASLKNGVLEIDVPKEKPTLKESKHKVKIE